MNAKMTASLLDEAEINNLLETKGSTNDAEIQSLLEDWIRDRRRVWDAFFDYVNPMPPAEWQEIVKRSTGLYEQMVESVLQAQAGALTTALRAFGPANSMKQLVSAWGEGMRRITETAAETQRKNGEVWSNALAKQSFTITEK